MQIKISRKILRNILVKIFEEKKSPNLESVKISEGHHS